LLHPLTSFSTPAVKNAVLGRILVGLLGVATSGGYADPDNASSKRDWDEVVVFVEPCGGVREFSQPYLVFDPKLWLEGARRWGGVCGGESQGEDLQASTGVFGCGGSKAGHS